MTNGKIPARSLLTPLVLALVPLLMAILLEFPAAAEAPDLPPTPDISTALEVGRGYEVVLDTGIVSVGVEAKISALAVGITPETGTTSGFAEPGR